MIVLVTKAKHDHLSGVPVLSAYLLRRYAAESKKAVAEMTPDALERLSAYHWPGNVRELANVIERAVVLGNGPSITLADLPGRIVASKTPVEPRDFSNRNAMEATRREIVLRALAQSHGNRAAAAKILGLHEKYFLRLVKTLGIS